MIQPSHHFGDAAHHMPRGQCRAVDHDHPQAQFTRRDQLGVGARAARIFGDDMADPLRAQQVQIVFGRKGSTRHNHRAIRQGRRLGRINQPQQIVMAARGKRGKVLLANRQENPGAVGWQGRDGACNISNMAPIILRLCAPGGPLQTDQAHAGYRASLKRIAAHLGGKRMGCIDHCADLLVLQIADQTRHPAKPADPRRQWLSDGSIGATSVGKHRISPCHGQSAGQSTGFAGTAKDKAARHV